MTLRDFPRYFFDRATGDYSQNPRASLLTDPSLLPTSEEGFGFDPFFSKDKFSIRKGGPFFFYRPLFFFGLAIGT